MMCGSTLIPATLIATTKGEALALVEDLLAARSNLESAGTRRPVYQPGHVPCSRPRAPTKKIDPQYRNRIR